MTRSQGNNEKRTEARQNQIVKLAQQDAFPDVVKILSKGEALSASNKICDLAPFLDTEGVVRLGGRIGRSSLPYGAKHPILLPANHPVTHSILSYYHAAIGHQGRSLTHAEIRYNGFHIFKIGRAHV